MTCGILGSAPQIFQIGILLRYCNEIYTVFDSDKAGNQARNLMDEIYKNYNMSMFGVKVYNVKLPTAKELSLDDDKDVDPDFFVKNYGSKKMIKIINETKQKEIDRCQQAV